MNITAVEQWVASNVPNIEQRPYQAEAWLRLWQRRSDQRKRALVHLATGLGKTSVAAVDALHYLKEEKPNGKILFVSHMNDISYQAKNTFLFVNPKFTTAIFRGKVTDVDVTFATFQGLYSQLENLDPTHFTYIIWDEAHHIEAETFSAVRKHFNPEFELGLTATPERADGRDILNYFGHPIFVKSLADGIAEGWLSAVDYHIVFDEAIKDAMRNKFELKTLKQIRELFASRMRNEAICKEVLQRRHDIGLDKAKTIVFCQNVESADEMAHLLGGEVYHSNVSADDRIDIMRRFKNGKLQVICTVDMFNEGIDIPDARLVVFLRSTSSRTIFEQQLGRGLRRAPGKDKVTVLDFVANVERINFVRDLGHTVSSMRGSGESYSGFNTSRKATTVTPEDNPYFNVSNFEFEYQAIEILERYDAIKGIEYLTTAEVVAEFERLGRVADVARHFNVSWNAIYKHLKKVGISTAGHLGNGDGMDIDAIKEKYQELKSVKQTAVFFGVSPWLVKTRLRKAGVEIHNRTAPKFASPELIAAYERSSSVRQAAREIGMPHFTALKQLKRAGIDTSQKKRLKGIPPGRLEQVYKESNGDICYIFNALKDRERQIGWTRIYKTLDTDGYLERRDGPITSAQAAAAWYKFGSSVKAGEYLGISGSLISRKAKGAQFVGKYGRRINNKHGRRKVAA